MPNYFYAVIDERNIVSVGVSSTKKARKERMEQHLNKKQYVAAFPVRADSSFAKFLKPYIVDENKLLWESGGTLRYGIVVADEAMTKAIRVMQTGEV